MDTAQIVDTIRELGALGVSTVVIIFLLRGDILVRRHHDDVVKSLTDQRDQALRDANYWREQAVRGVNVAQVLVSEGQTHGD